MPRCVYPRDSKPHNPPSSSQTHSLQSTSQNPNCTGINTFLDTFCQRLSNTQLCPPDLQSCPCSLVFDFLFGKRDSVVMCCVEGFYLTVRGGEEGCSVEDEGVDWSGRTAENGGRHLDRKGGLSVVGLWVFQERTEGRGRLAWCMCDRYRRKK